ncbi:nucleoside hydrolase [Dactylosporangium sp. CA-233914]|uniref:nucleoside hydrolase n=1 Tax=Dactylosporangium sp. CA-233914 TaxID=3239934 RepID=UPI003D92AAC4
MIDRRMMLKGIGVATAGALATTATASAASAEAASGSADSGSTNPSTTPQHDAFQVPRGPRARVMVFNDAFGDPDGLFAYAHALMCSSTQVTGVVSCLNRTGREASGQQSKTPATDGVAILNEVVKRMGLTGKVPVLAGSDTVLANRTTPQPSAAARALIAEAMRTDTTLPLFVTVGGTLTDVASAVLMEPAIANKFTLVWIGGGRYPAGGAEFNMTQDTTAAQVLFNDSNVSIWQIPSNAYAQIVTSDTEIQLNVAPCGSIGAYLWAKLVERKKSLAWANLGETYVMGDSPLVMVTALSSAFGGVNSSSATFQTVNAPTINNNGTYTANPSGRSIRVYDTIDSRLLLGDFFAKMKLNFGH